MRQLALSPKKLEAAANILRAKIEDIEIIISNVSKQSHSLAELQILQKKRQRYIKSLSKVLVKTWKIEFEAMCACEELKAQIPSYLGAPCPDYQVPKELIKYCKLDYKDE